MSIRHTKVAATLGAMGTSTAVPPVRRPRFRRAAERPAFRLTDGDVVMIRESARDRFLQKTTSGRSLDARPRQRPSSASLPYRLCRSPARPARPLPPKRGSSPMSLAIMVRIREVRLKPILIGNRVVRPSHLRAPWGSVLLLM